MNNDTGSGELLVLNKHTHQPCIHLLAYFYRILPWGMQIKFE